MIKRLLRTPVAMLIGFIATRPRLKANVRTMIARWPVLTNLTRRLTGQLSYQPPVRRSWRAPDAMSPRSERIYRHLKRARQARMD